LRRILVAPDSFKGTFSAPEVAEAMGRGTDSAVGPESQIDVDRCPVADGGEGTAEVLMEALGGRLATVPASDPLGRPIEAGFVLLGEGETAVVETATASGLTLVGEDELDPVVASTRGTGELLVAAAEAGARRILLAVGGTATSDGGRGAIAAIRSGGGLHGAELIILADVETAFEDAAVVFGPQKGASPAEVELLTRRLIESAHAFPRSPLGIPRTGAGGGIAGGLWATLGAEVVSGADHVLEAIDFDRRLARADRVLVGEGQLDQQSLDGKIVGNILERARRAGVPCHAIVGRNRLTEGESVSAGFASVQTASSLEEIEAAATNVS
jgi:glycerate kinase